MLHQHDDDDGGEQGEHGGGHHRGPVGLGFDADHTDDADDDGVEPRVGGDHQGPEELVPAVDEQDDEERGDVGGGDRDQDVAQEAQRSGSVHARGFDQFVGDRGENLTEQQRRGGGGDQRQGEAGEGVDQVEVGHHS